MTAASSACPAEAPGSNRDAPPLLQDQKGEARQALGCPWAFLFRATERTQFLAEVAGQTEAGGQAAGGLPRRVLG